MANSWRDLFLGTEYYIWPRWSLVDSVSSWKWTASGSGVGEFYLEIFAGGAPVHPNTGVALVDPPMVEGNALDFVQGTVGSLTASQFDWGDNDTLGFSTLYVRLADDADPDSKADDFVKAGGDDGAAGTSRAVAFETLKFAVENITKNVTNGDRITVLSGAADTYTITGVNITLSLYDTNATAIATFIVMGGDVVAGDRGIGRLTFETDARGWDDVTFDFGVMADLRIVADVASDAAFTTDREWVFDNVHSVNNATTLARALSTDSGSRLIDCYMEGESTSSDIILVGGNSIGAYRTKIVNRGNGGISILVSCANCLFIVNGNPGSGDQFAKTSARNSAFVCLGTPNADSRGLELADKENCTGMYFENIGKCIIVETGGDRMAIYDNVQFNCTTPIQYDATSSRPMIAEDIVDAGRSLFVDAAGGDFTIVAGSTPVHNILKNVGFSDPNYSIDETFDTYTDAGLGKKETTAVLQRPKRIM